MKTLLTAITIIASLFAIETLFAQSGEPENKRISLNVTVLIWGGVI